VPQDRKIDKSGQKLGVANSRCLPQLRIHADRSETWDRIQLVEEEFPSGSIKQQIDSVHSLTFDRQKNFSCDFLCAFDLRVGESCRDN
jgi:hypothetical protein